MADNRKFYIPWEAADLIVVENLREQFDYLTKENTELTSMAEVDEMPDHKIADMVYNIKVLNALRIVLKHYGAEPQ